MKIALDMMGIELSKYYLKELCKGFHELECEVYYCQTPQDLLKLLNEQVYGLGFNFYCGYQFFIKSKIPYYLILMDHPFHFEKFFIESQNHADLLHIICIDKNHEIFINTYYPYLKTIFIPLGGTYLRKPIKKDKDFDICMTGCYRPIIFSPFDNMRDVQLKNKIQNIKEEMINNPTLLLEEQYRKYFDEKNIGCNLSILAPVDTAIRSYYRGKAIQLLADNGFKVHVMGSGWEKLECKNKQNIIQVKSNNAYGTPAQCVELQYNSKISLNVMPWFKDGAHDRIFSAMANGSLSLTDESKYLKENFIDDINIGFYTLENMEEELLTKADKYLSNPIKLQQITEAGYELALKKHTWEKRAEEIFKYINSNC